MNRANLYPKWEDIVEFGADGPVHKKLVETPGYRSVIVGMEKSQSIPPHAAKAATFHFLQGSGRVKAGDEELGVSAGATVVVPDGVPRGIEADTRLVFLASHGSPLQPARKPRMKVPVAVMIGGLVMIGLMAGVMFGPALMMSRAGITAVGMNSLMYLPLMGLALMAVMMVFFYRRMMRGGRRRGHIMDANADNVTGNTSGSGIASINSPSTDILTAEYDVPDVSCAHCRLTIESEIGHIPGVISVEVNIQAKKVTVSYQEPATASAIESQLTEIGYPAIPK